MLGVIILVYFALSYWMFLVLMWSPDKPGTNYWSENLRRQRDFLFISAMMLLAGGLMFLFGSVSETIRVTRGSLARLANFGKEMRELHQQCYLALLEQQSHSKSDGHEEI